MPLYEPARAPVTLLSAEFPPFGFIPPEVRAVEPLPDHIDSVASLVRAVRDGTLAPAPPHPLARWPFRALEPLRDEPTEGALRAWLVEHTVASVSCDLDTGLAQCAHVLDDGTLRAHYLFDARYAAAHPAWTVPEHVALWHGTIAAKLFDDGVSLHTPAQLAAVVHWVSIRAKGAALDRTGRRERSDPSR